MNLRTSLITDNFPGVALSGNYTLAEGTFVVSANVCDAVGDGGSGDSFAYRNAESYNNDQFSKLLISGAIQIGIGVMCTVRFSGQFGVGAGMSGYLAYSDSATYEIGKWVNDTYTSIFNTSTGVPQIGDSMAIEVIGNALFGYKNDIPMTSISLNDYSILTGTPGFGGFGDALFTNAEFGNCFNPNLNPDYSRFPIKQIIPGTKKTYRFVP